MAYFVLMVPLRGSTHSLTMLPVALAWSFSGGAVIYEVLRVDRRIAASHCPAIVRRRH